MASVSDSFKCPLTLEVFRDPVIAPDGITYERAAIEDWIARGNKTSPVTRKPISAGSLVPNFALKSLIDEQVASGAIVLESVAPAASAAAGQASASAGSADLQLGCAPIEGSNGTRYHLSVTAADTDDVLPVLMISIIDISGSMGSASVDTSTVQTDAALLSRADLVRHAVATQIELLRPQDELAVVLFDNRVKTALKPVLMTADGRNKARAMLHQITDAGGTSLWRGLEAGLTLMHSHAERGPRHVALILQTDGQEDRSSIPPRGTIEAFKSWRERHPASSFSMHTVGYGYGADLDTPLLRGLAEASGSAGMYAYIPDGSMVGTVFIHLVSMCLSARYYDARLAIQTAPGVRLLNESDRLIDVGLLHGGQARDFIIELALPAGHTGPVFEALLTTHKATAQAKIVALADAPAEPVGFADARARLVAWLAHTIAEAENGRFSVESTDELFAFLVRYRDADARIEAFIEDLRHADKHKGQLEKSLEPDAFARWGRHYLPAYLHGQRVQFPTNFRDSGSKIYGGEVAKALVLRGDDLFNSLPPPQPGHAAVRGGVIHGHGAAAAAAPVAVSMAAINSAYGPCFAGDGLVALASGACARVDALRRGDLVLGGHRIACVVRTAQPGGCAVVRLGAGVGAGFTPNHPVIDSATGCWASPASLGRVQHESLEAVFNFVLESGHTLVINGVRTCTLAHGLRGPVVEHAYFGTDAVLGDLVGARGWAEGYVSLSNVRPVRSAATGWVERMTFDCE